MLFNVEYSEDMVKLLLESLPGTTLVCVRVIAPTSSPTELPATELSLQTKKLVSTVASLETTLPLDEGVKQALIFSVSSSESVSINMG